ncbi:MAG: DUF1080 domain-containing protein [Kiritimatiellae bacterium]|nr:DUF1080 domain-containing protein [Kiritimatiellia bacterium]
MKIKTIAAAGAAVLATAGCCGLNSAEKGACAPSCECGRVYPDSVNEGFVSLFNGYDLEGWQGATAMYGVDPKEPGVLQCFPDRKLPPGQRGDLVTAKEFGNFILRFEFAMPPNGNNGLGIRISDPDKDAAYHAMCELQLLDDGGSSYYDASNKVDKLKPYQYTGSVYGVVPSLRDNVDKQIWGKEKNFTGGGSYVRKPGMWNFEEVKVIGSEIEVYLNGYLITKADLSKFKGDGDTPDHCKHPGLHNRRGRIGWLGHGSNVKWKNIRIKPLPDDAKMGEVCPRQKMAAPAGFETYFDGCPGQIAKMWKGVTTEGGFDKPATRAAATAEKNAEMQKIADKGRDEHWHVRNGNLFFDGYRGGYSLATKRNYGDFEMWCDWRIMSITGDSGLYLRGVPQVQIWDAHNQWHIGSGGLYNNNTAKTGNLSKALKIADRQVGDWNRFHVIMRGDKVSVWLNGELVVDNTVLENLWQRDKPVPASEQIELQCHGDPTEWRNIFIKAL